MPDDKKDEKKCLKAGDFTIEICEKKDKPPKKDDPIPAWKIIVTLTITLGISFQLIDEETNLEPDVVVTREDRIDEVVIDEGVINEVTVDEITVDEFTVMTENSAEGTVQQIELTTLRAVETLHTTIRQALIREDYAVITPLLTNGIYWIGDTYAPLDVTVLKDIDSPVMQSLEKAIAAGCTSYDSIDLTPAYWICPGTLAPVPLEHFTTSPTVFINGNQVNIRQTPSLEGEIITTVSYQTVLLNQSAIAAFSEVERMALITPSGWCPVILTDGQSGYVSSQFCRPVMQAHAVFRNVDGQWEMVVVMP